MQRARKGVLLRNFDGILQNPRAIVQTAPQKGTDEETKTGLCLIADPVTECGIVHDDRL